MATKNFLKYWWPGLTAVAALVIATVSISKVAPLVSAGNSARQLQIELAPSSCKRYVANYREGVWTLMDLKRVSANIPVPCPGADAIIESFKHHTPPDVPAP